MVGATARAEPKSWRFLTGLWLVLVALILLILWVARYYPIAREPWITTARNGLERAAFLSLVLGVVYRISRSPDRRKQGLLGVGLLLLLWLDVATHVPPQNPTVARTVYEPGLRPLQELKPKPRAGESRAMLSFSARVQFLFTLVSDPFNGYLGSRLGQYADCNLLDGLPKVDGFYALYVKEECETRTLLYLSTNTIPANYLNREFLARGIFQISTNNLVTNLSDFLGVCQITAPGKIFDWEARASYMPLLTAGQRPVFVEATASLGSLLDPTFNPREMVFLPVDAKPHITVTNQTQARIVPRTFSAHRVVLEVEAEQPSMVIAAQTFYPCWRAYVDGQPARLWHANHAFQALQVPAGPHRVELIYQDRSFFVGLIISGITLLACLAGLVQRQETNGVVFMKRGTAKTVVVPGND